jgi:hypothetical protein
MRALPAAFAALLLCAVPAAFGQSAPAVPDPSHSLTELDSTPAPASFDELMGRVSAQERAFNQRMLTLHPLIETYIQNVRDDDEMGPVPVSDRYFLGRLDLAGKLDDGFANQAKHSLLPAKLSALSVVNELYS